jgi:ubiquinone/menaquinone biosynthesis C-methylase UbiE
MILEIGCGEGSLLKLLSRDNEVHGADISRSGVALTREKGITCHHIDASNEKLQYGDDHFDVIITLETIEHVENPHRMIWEIKRLLKPKGQLLISIPGQGVDHPFIYPGFFTVKNFGEFLKVNGFYIDAIKWWGQSPMMARFVNRLEAKGGFFRKRIAGILFYIGRKRNLF